MSIPQGSGGLIRLVDQGWLASSLRGASEWQIDALHFRSESGGTVDPETVWRFKLDMIGRRMRPGHRKA